MIAFPAGCPDRLLLLRKGGGGGYDLMSSFFENLGRKLGRAAVPTYHKSKWIWQGLTGSEEDAIRAEKDLGETLATELRQSSEILHEPDLLHWIRGICHQLEKSVGQTGFQYHCELMKGDHPSIICLPGGFLFVSRSLVEFCEGSVDEVAFVIAHETAHVIRRHTWDRMIQQSALRAASFAAGRAGLLSGWLRQQGLPMLRSAHSKEFEFEADQDGIGLIRAAGYDPEAAVSFLRRIERLGTDPELLGEYLASHPAPGERISRLSSITN